MPNVKRIGGGPGKYGQKSDDLTWNDPCAGFRTVSVVVGQIGVNVALNVPINTFGCDGQESR